MDTISQSDAIAMAPIAGDERARFFTADRFDRLECLTATFRTHCYAPHTHETYAIGAILAGVETWNARGARHYAGPGDLAFNNPFDVHDGAPHGAGYSYRMTYPSIDLLQRIACEVSGRDDAGVPFFPAPAIYDPEGVALFAAAHRVLEHGTDALEGDERLYRAFTHCVVRHAEIRPAATGREPGPIARVRALLAERHAEDLTLAQLAAEAGLSPHHLIRAFRRETGHTPHAYLIDRRIDVARVRLRRGESPADVAAATGFCDQAHLTRAFKARVGVTPGAFRTGTAR